MGGARRAAARRSCPPLSPLRPSRALLRYARKPPASAVGFFCASAGGFRAVAAVRPLARCRPRARSPVARSLAASPRPAALRRGCARPPRPSGALRAALRPAPCGRPPAAAGSPAVALRFCRAPCWAAGAPAGAPLPPGWCCPLRPRGLLPRRGLSRRAALRRSGGSVPRPRRAGVWRAAARRPAAAVEHPQGSPVLAGICKPGLDNLHFP